MKTYSGKEFIQKAIDDSTKWNKGTTPKFDVIYHFLASNLVGTRVIVKAELRDKIQYMDPCCRYLARMILGEVP